MKTGTHSVQRMLKSYRSRHEPESRMLLTSVLAQRKGLLSEKQVNRILRLRNINLHLEIESSHHLGPFVPSLVQLFPESKFVFTTRECISWMDSLLNFTLEKDLSKKELQAAFGRGVRFDIGLSYSPHDGPLESLGFRPLRSYFRYWTEHNRTIISSVPAERLLTIKMRNLPKSADHLARFLGIDVSTISVTDSHRFKTKTKHHFLNSLDRQYVLDVAQEECELVHSSLFPGISIENDLNAILDS